MLTYYHALAVACILILVLIYLAPAQPLPALEPRASGSQPIPTGVERFDTYRNHDMAAEAWRGNVYGATNIAVGAPPGVRACNSRGNTEGVSELLRDESRSCSGSPATLASPMVDSRIDRYTWNERDASGDNIYDKVYEQQTLRQFSPVPTYYGPEDIYTMNSGTAVTYFNGEPIHLSQSG